MIGKSISHYKITAKLGAGGMGDVYLAEDTRLGRKDALKFLSSALREDPEAKERLLREARAASVLSHPNIMTVHAVEELDGYEFIAMEYIEGVPLDQWCRERNPDVASIVSLVVQISDALINAHENGIVHRDLKPANILIGKDDRPRVLDFGLAKQEGTTKLTQAGSTVGTMAYMSPEQAVGEDVDQRSDIFSLGIILYELLTGSRPFEGRHDAAIMYAIVNEEPIPIGQLRPDLPAGLEQIVASCLAKDRKKRFQSAAELRDALRVLHGQVSGGFPAVSGPTSALSVLRRPSVAIPGVLVVLGLIAGTLWVMQRSAKQRWAREVAIPKVAELLDAAPGFTGPAMWLADSLGTEAGLYIPDDPVLDQLRRRYASTITIHSTPPGAKVYAKPYPPTAGDWELLGETPIDSLGFVRALARVRIEKDGFEPIEDLYWSGRFSGESAGYVLREIGSIPEGMVWVSESAPDLRVSGAPAGLHMPGIEHLPCPRIGSFFIDRTEITSRDYKLFVDANGYADPKFWKEDFVDDGVTLSWADAVARFTDKTQRPGPATWEAGDYPDGMGDYPVTSISWFEACAYAEFAGKKLPSVYHWDRVALTWASADIVPISNLSGKQLVAAGSLSAFNRYGTVDLGGNAREWCVNASNLGDRFILGGGWSDPAYAFNDAFAQPPWDRSEINGLRCIKYADTNLDFASIEGTIDLPFRDFMAEPKVSDDVFALYLNQFRYDAMPLDAEVEETIEGEDYTREKVTFSAGYGRERMMAYLFLPKNGRAPFQTTVLFPGSGAIHTRSSASLTPAPNTFLLKNGRALLYPIYKSTFERGDGLVSDYPDETNHWKEHVIMWGKDFRRSIDYLETRDDIDTARFAFIGISWGAAMGPIVMAIEPRIKAGIVVVAGLLFQHSLPEVDAIHYAPRVRIPVLMLNGKYDFFFPYETSQMPFYELLGTPREHKKLVVHEASHAFPRTEQARETLEWLDQYLGAVGK